MLKFLVSLQAAVLKVNFMTRQCIFASLVFFEVTVFSSTGFAAPDYSGNCTFHISKNGKPYEKAGNAFMTAKIDAILDNRGNINLKNRHIISSSHVAVYPGDVETRIDRGESYADAFKAELESTSILIKCGDIEFNVKRNVVASKPLVPGNLSLIGPSTTKECAINTMDPEYNSREEGLLLRRGCDLSVYTLIPETIKKNGKKVGLDVLDRITGFTPVYMEHRNEIKKVLIETDKQGQYISCPITKSIRGTIIVRCDDLKSIINLVEGKNAKIHSGTVVFPEDEKKHGVPVYLPGNKRTALGVINEIVDNKSKNRVHFVIDLISVSSDYLNPTPSSNRTQ
jgi:hypothetical protein